MIRACMALFLLPIAMLPANALAADPVAALLRARKCVSPTPETCPPLARIGQKLRRPDAPVVTALSEALSSPDPAARLRIAQALAHLSGDTALRLLLRADVRERVGAIRQAVHAGLSAYPEPDIDRMSSTLETSENEEERVDAATLLGTRGSSDHARTTLLRLAHDRSERVAHAAIRSMGVREDPRFIPALLDIAGTLGAPSAHRHRALTSLATREIPEAGPIALCFFGHPEPELHRAALATLARLRTPYGREAIVRSLDTLALIGPAAKALADLAHAPAAPALLATLARTDLSETQRAQVMDAIGRMRIREAAIPLLRRLQGADDREASGIARALGRIGDVTAIPMLIRTLERSPAHTKDMALWALEALTDEKHGRDPAAWDRWVAAEEKSRDAPGTSSRRRSLQERSTLRSPSGSRSNASTR